MLSTSIIRGAQLYNALGATMYQRILLVVGDGHMSYLALYQTVVVSKATSAEVETLLAVDSSDIAFNMTGSNSIAYTKQVTNHGRDMSTEVSKRLDAVDIKYSAKLFENSTALGQISATIVVRTNEAVADLTVLDIRGRCGLKHLVLSSIAKGMVRKINESVLMVRSEVEE